MVNIIVFQLSYQKCFFHRAEMKEAMKENERRKNEITNLTRKSKELENIIQHKDKQLNKMNSKISMLENYIKKYTQQVRLVGLNLAFSGSFSGARNLARKYLFFMSVV